MRFVFHYPETNGVDGDFLDPGPLHDLARAAERAGFGALSLTEHPVPSAKWLAAGGHQSLDPFVGLAFAAAATERLRLLTHLALAPYRNPFLLAKAAATLDKLSGGRLILGLGAGYQKSEFYALGVEMGERGGALFDELLDCLPLHWSGEPFSYKGLHFEARDVIARPRPVQDPIPIWIGGNSKAARRRAVERAQGWMPMMGSAELSTTTQTSTLATFADVAIAIREMNEAADTAGRVEPLDYLCSYSDGSIARPTEEADRHREAFAAMEQAGLTWAIVSHPRAEPAAISEIHRDFGATYL